MRIYRGFFPASQAMPIHNPEVQRPLLQVQGLKVSFRSEGDWVDVIQGVDFTVQRGEVVAVVGESGSGKSVSALAIMAGFKPQCRYALTQSYFA